jgi:hypothetical protein
MLDADGNVRDIPQDPDETDNTDPDDAGQDDQQP